MKEKTKMINGERYNAIDPQLVLERDKAGRLCHKFNKRLFLEINLRNRTIKKLLNTKGNFLIKPPFYCDYGYNIFIGKNVIMNYGCTLLDVCEIHIGDGVLIGPNTQIYTACHGIDPEERRSGVEYGKPIHIADNVWIGGASVILPGVNIGENSVIGAGSVVTHDIPENVIAAGNPCRIIRPLSDQDKMEKPTI